MRVMICILGLAAAMALPAQQEPVIRNGETFSYAAIEGRGAYSQFAARMGELMQALQQQGVDAAGTPIGVFHNFPPQVAEADLAWDVAVPVDDAQAVRPPLVKKRFACEQMAEVIHRGPYGDSSAAIARLMQFVAASGYAPAGPVVETYLDDPETVRDADRRTRITVPVVKR